VPTVQTVDSGARAKLRNNRTDDRAPYREVIANLSGDRALELTPGDGETLRKLKMTITRAASDVGRVIKYGETEEGTLLVWLADQGAAGKRRTQRRKVDPADLVAREQ